MKYLVAGLGNIGDEYYGTRHNIGFSILDAWAGDAGFSFSDRRYGAVATTTHRGRTIVLLKPSTFMNLSGNAVIYWMKKEKIHADRLLVVVDDIALPFGSVRLRKQGGDGGHNGLYHINSVLGHSNYARIRFGLGHDFPQGMQSDYVLGKWSIDEKPLLKPGIDLAIEMIKSFAFIGVELTMTKYNRKSGLNGENDNGGHED